MAGVALDRSAAGLADVADVEARQPTRVAVRLRSSMKATVTGLPQWWLRTRRIACHVGPVSGSCDAAGEAAAAGLADGVGLMGRRRGLPREERHRGLGPGRRGERGEREAGREDATDHGGVPGCSLSVFTQYSSQRLRRNRRMTGETPRRCEPVGR